MDANSESLEAVAKNRRLLDRYRTWGASGGAFLGGTLAALLTEPTHYANFFLFLLVISLACGIGALGGYLFFEYFIASLAVRGPIQTGLTPGGSTEASEADASSGEGGGGDGASD